MKKIPRSIYFLFMAMIIFLLSGCGGDDDDEPAKGKLMVLTSSVFERGESYKLYRGSNLRIISTDAKYYVAPINDVDENSELISLNLQFKEDLSQDLPFVITKADNDTAIVFAYNPNGTTELLRLTAVYYVSEAEHSS